MGLFESLQRRIFAPAKDWPPQEVREHWEKIQDYQRRFKNDAEELLMYNPTFSGSYDTAQLFTPVPLTREMARLSAALLFSASPTITHTTYQDEIDELRRVNGLDPFFQSAAESVAVEGRGAFRIIWDDEATGLTGLPVIDYVHEDQILWGEKHGRFVVGGTVVIEREDEPRGVIYRLLEEHGRGWVARTLFKGDSTRLGREVSLSDPEVLELFPDYEMLDESYETNLDVPTLIRWDNVPGGYSDIAPVETLLDRLDEAESLLLDKGRKSVPVTFADETMVEDRGRLVIPGVVFLKASSMLPTDTDPMVETIQPGFDVAAHVEWIEHIQNTILLHSGYSLASWGMEQAGIAGSGKALKLSQARTLLTKAGKDRMAVEAIRTAIATALALAAGGGDIQSYKPDLVLGDGMPEDAIENAQQIQLEDSAGAVSLEQKVRTIHPDWDDEAIGEEVTKIEGDQKKQLLLEAANSPQPFAPPGSPGGSKSGADKARGTSGDSTSGAQPKRKDRSN